MQTTKGPRCGPNLGPKCGYPEYHFQVHGPHFRDPKFALHLRPVVVLFAGSWTHTCAGVRFFTVASMVVLGGTPVRRCSDSEHR